MKKSSVYDRNWPKMDQISQYLVRPGTPHPPPRDPLAAPATARPQGTPGPSRTLPDPQNPPRTPPGPPFFDSFQGFGCKTANSYRTQRFFGFLLFFWLFWNFLLKNMSQRRFYRESLDYSWFLMWDIGFWLLVVSWNLGFTLSRSFSFPLLLFRICFISLFIS